MNDARRDKIVADFVMLLWRLHIVQIKVGNRFTHPSVKESMKLHHHSLIGGTFWYLYDDN